MNMKEEKDTILRVENVSKEYRLGVVSGQTFRDAIKARRKSVENVGANKLFTALRNVSFEVKRGETVGLIGPNGAGKSTLLKLISRITAPTEGRIYLDGRVSSMLEVGTGFHQELTGRENIYLNGSILGMSRKEIDRKMDSIIEFSECGKFIDTPVKRYSSGMYVKLAFAVASHLESEIMIMDEVLAVGDVKFQQKCLNKMKEVAEREGRTILYVSHNMDTIHKLCGRCLVLNEGRLEFDGAVEEATRIYRGDDIRTETFADFTGYLRPGWLCRDEVRLSCAEIYRNDTNIVGENEMELKLWWRTNKAVEHLCLRVELMDDSEIPFATAVFYDFFSGGPGEEAEKVFRIDLRSVMNGCYRTYYTLFCMDSYQQSVDIDCVRGLDFVVKKKAKDGELQWKNGAWGNIKLC